MKGAIDISSSPEKEGTPLRTIFCLKKNVNMREIEDKEDCFLLDFNPDDDCLDISKLLASSKDLHNSDSPDISVVAEKGQVACRDYPHPRHLCLKKPFEKTPHESYCELCYCFVCDKAAPCQYWSGQGHCHAIDNEGWKNQRRARRKLK